MGNDLKENENCFELAGGSSYRGFELTGVDCTFNVRPLILFSQALDEWALVEYQLISLTRTIE